MIVGIPVSTSTTMSSYARSNLNTCSNNMMLCFPNDEDLRRSMAYAPDKVQMKKTDVEEVVFGLRPYIDNFWL